jgi:tetratricopeptide (TPR) repeat protein
MGDSTTTRPVATANGTLAKTPFLHLLVYALEKKLTGTIELFAADKRSAAILFADGQPAKARTSESVLHLGRVLQELGHVTEEQLTRSLADLAKAKAARPVLHGELLISQGILDASQVRTGLREQLGRKLRHIAAMPADTRFAYYEGFDSLRSWGGDGEGIDPVPLLWGMLLEYAPWDHVQAALARVAPSPLRLVRGGGIDRLRLTKEELVAVDLLRARPMRTSDLARVARLNDRTAQLLVYLLLVTKQVDVVSAADAALARPQSAPSMPASVSESKLRPRSQTPLPRTPSVGKTSTPRMTPMPSGTSVPPASHVSITPIPSAAVRGSTPPGQFGRSSSPSGQFGKSSSPSGQFAKNPTPVPPSALSPELAERWQEIVSRAATIDRADYFMMLDIARDATQSEVESAFFALAKRWHPDRLPPELATVRDACSRVFGRISEAHATLTDDEQRALYMRLLIDGSGSPETQATVAKVIEAAKNFQKAEVCLRRNDFAQAEVFCRRALEDDATQPDYLAMLAWLVALKEENQSPERTMESIQMLERAIAMNDACERAYFWRGMLNKRLGKNELAVRDFRRAFDLNPRNIDAGREVRLYHMRGGRRSSKPPAKRTSSSMSMPKAEDPAKPGLLNRLFKKP